MQAGEKVKALKCLIRSGNTDKIIFFAGVSRHAEIYTLAANYLQTLDWHSRPDLAQSIVTFYTKVRWQDSPRYLRGPQMMYCTYHCCATAVSAVQQVQVLYNNSKCCTTGPVPYNTCHLPALCNLVCLGSSTAIPMLILTPVQFTTSPIRPLQLVLFHIIILTRECASAAMPAVIAC